MRRFWEIAVSKLRRDRGLPWRQLLDKRVQHAASTLVAPFFLRRASHVGQRVRPLGGGPRIINDSRISSHVVVGELCTAPEAELRIGNGVHLTSGVSLGATKSLRLGDHVRLGPYTRVVDSDAYDVFDRSQPAVPKPVVIDDDAWLGMPVIVLPGVHNGKGSVATTDVPDSTVVGGVPAKVLRTLDPTKHARPAARPN